MDDQIRVSDAERDGVTARLRDHYAEGRLTHAEFDERVSVTLNAKTRGELRDVMADLPGSGSAPLTPAGPAGAPIGPASRRPGAVRRRPSGRVRPRLLPVALIALAAAVLAPDIGWLLFAVVRFVLLLWLVTFAAGIITTGRLARRTRGGQWQDQERHWPGPHWAGPSRW